MSLLKKLSENYNLLTLSRTTDSNVKVDRQDRNGFHAHRNATAKLGCHYPLQYIAYCWAISPRALSIVPPTQNP
jgi:hypothetical protein